DQHRIGWAIAGGCAALSVLITLFSVWTYARNYWNRAEQRQNVRTPYLSFMLIYGIISFLSFRFFRDYTYYSLVEVVYEAYPSLHVLIAMVLIIFNCHSFVVRVIRLKDKQPLPFPFCFWRFRPTKIYFMYTIKWSVMQYVIISPLLCVIGIITQALGVLCVQIYSPHFAEVYIVAIDFVSISVALYGLILFYNLTRTELVGRRPLAKFLCIKGTSLLTFYQECVFSVLQKYKVIHATEFWTATNVADGLNALAITIEMVFFAAFMLWAYPASEYKDDSLPKTSIWRPLWDSINYG
ncbi:hypothetical protein M422DRAFT_109815, partial [Sphaerobolus stellatus SS14]